MPDIRRRVAPQFQTLTHLLMLAMGDSRYPLSDVSQQLRRTIIRLIDKANRDYLTARDHMIQQLEEGKRSTEELMQGRNIYMFGFIDHIEDCIITCRRLLVLFKEIAEDPCLKDNKAISDIFDPKLSKAVTDFRNTIEHMQQRISSGHIRDGNPVVISLSEDSHSVVIGNDLLSLSDLANLLTRFHFAGCSLLPRFSSEPPEDSF